MKYHSDYAVEIFRWWLCGSVPRELVTGDYNSNFNDHHDSYRQTPQSVEKRFMVPSASPLSLFFYPYFLDLVAIFTICIQCLSADTIH